MRIIAFCLLALVHSVDNCYANNPSETRNPRRDVTVDYLYEACSAVGETAKGDIPYFDCESYVYGVLDTYNKVRDAIPKASRACFPPHIEPWRVLELANPKPGSYRKDQSAASFLIDFLKKRYPCS
jgi:Rap1a immunity proteins